MPVVPFIPAALAVGSSLYSGSQANKAANKQIDAQTAATDKSLAAQQQQLSQTRADQTPYMQAGYQGIDALLGQLGLSSGGSGASARMAAAAQPAPSSTPDYAGYVMNNPDLAALWASHSGQAKGKTIEQFGAEHWNTHGQTENRPYTPTTAAEQAQQAQLAAQQASTPDQAPADPNAAPDPTASEPVPAARPDYLTGKTTLADFEASPDYQFRLNEGSRNLNAFNAAKGVLGSGAAGKALVDYGQNTAAAEYGDFFNRQTGEAQKQNAFNLDTYNSDRAYNASRYDTKTTNLFKLAGIGSAAAGANQSAGSAFANNASNIYQTDANVMSDAYGQKANANAQMVGGIAGGLQSAFGAFSSGAPATAAPKPGYTAANTGYTGQITGLY